MPTKRTVRETVNEGDGDGDGQRIICPSCPEPERERPVLNILSGTRD